MPLQTKWTKWKGLLQPPSDEVNSKRLPLRWWIQSSCQIRQKGPWDQRLHCVSKTHLPLRDKNSLKCKFLSAVCPQSRALHHRQDTSNISELLSLPASSASKIIPKCDLSSFLLFPDMHFLHVSHGGLFQVTQTTLWCQKHEQAKLSRQKCYLWNDLTADKKTSKIMWMMLLGFFLNPSPFFYVSPFYQGS